MKILIVDDEPLIHLSIEKLILKCGDSYSVLHAKNGREMLACLKENFIDLAYVDIKMPGISGLEALKEGKEISPGTSYYIMTGFDEFEYAKQAVKLKVDDYLMKPLDFMTIKETLEAAGMQCRQRLEQQKTGIRNWLESTVNNRESNHPELYELYCGAVLVAVDFPRVPSDFLCRFLLPFDENLVSLMVSDGLLILVFGRKYQEVNDILKNMAKLPYSLGISVFASGIVRDPAKLKESLFRIGKLAALRVLSGTGKFYYESALPSGADTPLAFCSLCLRWRDALKRGSYEEFAGLGQRILGQYENHPVSYGTQSALLQFFSLVLGEEGSAETLEEVRNLCRRHGDKMLNASALNQSEVLIPFIREHYREDISAADIAQRTGISAASISALLKAATGMKYTDYITFLRMNHAKDLLVNTRKTIKEVTADCGYYSQSHFTKVFSEAEGCTPMEYRRKKLDGANRSESRSEGQDFL